jgi:ABC-type uncharacterized transport system permease subunit
MNLPFDIRFEKRSEDNPWWLPAATSLGAIVAAFIVSGILLKLIGGQPLVVGKFFWSHFWQLADDIRYVGQSHPADFGGLGLCGGFQDEVMEHWR